MGEIIIQRRGFILGAALSLFAAPAIVRASSCGIVKPHQKDENHLSFWMFFAFSPENAILKIEPL